MRRIETSLWNKVQEIVRAAVEATIYVDSISGNWIVEYFPA